MSFESGLLDRKCRSRHASQHYDDSVKDSVTGDKSEWTLLVYITGAEDGVQGGEVCVNKQVFFVARELNAMQTIFQLEEGEGKRRTTRPLVPPLSRGMALLHRSVRPSLLRV